jgi:hypothetical protein
MNPMGHLILDHRLGRYRLGRWGLLLYLPALLSLPLTLMPELITALMIGSWFLSMDTSREILQLPLSRKQLWRTRWIFAFTFPLFHLFSRLAQLGIAAMRGREVAFSLSWALLIFLFQLSTLGILAVLSGPIRQRISKLLRPPRRFHDFFFLNVYPAGYLLVTLVAMGTLILLESPAYRQMAEWPTGVSPFLAVGLCIAAMSFCHSPQIAARSVMEMSPCKSRGANKPRPLTKSWVTGPAFFVWTQIRSALLKAMIFGSLYLLLWWITDWFLFKRFTIFSDGPHPLAAVLLLALSFGSSSGYFLGTNTLGLRHFRVLPLSTRTLAAMITLLPVLFCLCSWVAPVAAYRIISGHLPWALRLDLFCALAGLSSLVGSVALRAAGTPARILSLSLLFIAAGFSGSLYRTPLPPAPPGLIVGLLGLAGIAVSFVLNARALRRGSSIYKPVLPPSGVSQPRWISEF